MKILLFKINLVLLLIFIYSCNFSDSQTPINSSIKEFENESTNQQKEEVNVEMEWDEFSRDSSFKIIESKIRIETPLVVHLRIPLCDNDNQGIVPVSEKLGNGLDLNNNLYWGAKYGFKNHFRKYTNWKLLQSEKDINPLVLERVVFYKEFLNSAKVYIVADAYRGDKMEECLTEYIRSISGNRSENIELNGMEIGIGSNADLIILNGHNGLMDYEVEFVKSSDNKIRESAVIGCLSHKYFKNHFLNSKGYPVLMTTNLMAPEAYVVEALIESWAKLYSGKEIRKEVGKAYDKYQKCGIKGATRLFKTGW